MAMFLRFDGTNDRVSIPATPSMTGDWEIRIRCVPRVNADVQVAGTNATFNRQLTLRVASDTVRVRGVTGTSYDVPCVLNQGEYIDLKITSTISPARMTVFKNTGTTASPTWVQQGQITFTQGIDLFDTIGNISTSFAQLDLYELQFKDASNDRRYLTDGITSGTVLPDVNNSANNGTLINFTGNPWIDDSLAVLPTPVVVGASTSGTTVSPFVDGAASVDFTGHSAPITISSGAFTFTMPGFEDDSTWFRVPAVSETFTVVQGGTSYAMTRPVSLPADFDVLRDTLGNPANFDNIITDDDNYLGYWFNEDGNPLTVNDTAYWDDSTGLFIDRDGGVSLPEASSPLTTTIYIHRASGKVYAHEFTITESGIVSAQGLTSVGLTSVGLTQIGLTSVGLCQPSRY